MADQTAQSLNRYYLRLLDLTTVGALEDLMEVRPFPVPPPLLVKGIVRPRIIWITSFKSSMVICRTKMELPLDNTVSLSHLSDSQFHTTSSLLLPYIEDQEANTGVQISQFEQLLEKVLVLVMIRTRYHLFDCKYPDTTFISVVYIPKCVDSRPLHIFL